MECIINADDYGSRRSVNAAVLHCFQNRWISSATVMANMPAFAEACQIAHAFGFAGHIGIHVVLSAGEPLTDRIKQQTRFCHKDGFFRPRPRSKRFLYLSTDEKIAVATEAAAQIDRCRGEGIALSHLDTHHHFHEEWGIIRVLAGIAKDRHIPYVRLMRNTSRSCRLHRKIYASLYNRWLRRKGLARTEFFGSMYDYMEFRQKNCAYGETGSFEIMLHPDHVNGEVVDLEDRQPVGRLIEAAGIKEMESF